MQKELKAQIERLKAAGATYVDARWYPVEETNNLLMWNGNLKNTSASRESGPDSCLRPTRSLHAGGAAGTPCAR